MLIDSPTPLLKDLWINGGSTIGLTVNSTLQFTTGFNSGSSANGIFNLTINAGGTFQKTTGTEQVSFARSAGSQVTVNQTGGKFLVASGASLQLTNNATATATYNLSGGELNAGLYLNPGAGTVNFNWTGGSLTATNIGLAALNNSGTGVFNVGGTDAVGTTFLFAGNVLYTQGSDASTVLDFASDSSYDKVETTVAGGTLSLDGTIELNLLSSYVPTEGLTFDVMKAADIINNGFTLTGTGLEYFTYEIVTSGQYEVLRLTAVPEPSVMGLLAGSVFLTVLCKRRRLVLG